MHLLLEKSYITYGNVLWLKWQLTVVPRHWSESSLVAVSFCFLRYHCICKAYKIHSHSLIVSSPLITYLKNQLFQCMTYTCIQLLCESYYMYAKTRRSLSLCRGRSEHSPFSQACSSVRDGMSLVRSRMSCQLVKVPFRTKFSICGRGVAQDWMTLWSRSQRLKGRAHTAPGLAHRKNSLHYTFNRLKSIYFNCKDNDLFVFQLVSG